MIHEDSIPLQIIAHFKYYVILSFKPCYEFYYSEHNKWYENQPKYDGMRHYQKRRYAYDECPYNQARII